MATAQAFAPDRLVKVRSEKAASQWTIRQTILYNLGIGFGAAAIEDDTLLRFSIRNMASISR